jgi:hypothetical protein
MSGKDSGGIRFELPPGWAEPPTGTRPKHNETSMLNIAKSETVKQRSAMAYIGVRIPQALLQEIDAMSGSRSETIRELLQFALDVKHQGRR